MKQMYQRVFGLFIAAIAFARADAGAQGPSGLTWPGCTDLAASDFRKVDLNIAHPAAPTKMQIAADGRMFFSTGAGTIWMYEPATQATTTIATISVQGGGSVFGLVGMVLDPGFLANGWMYLLYNPKAATGDTTVPYQLWRYTLAAGKLDMASGKKLIEYTADMLKEAGAGRVDHSGGGMAFDAQGNLYFATGENSWWELNYGNVDETRIWYNSLRTAGNTNDLRGKINRIHPEPDGSYTVPEGNLFRPGTAGTRAEIFAMGFRNPWSLQVDKSTGTVVWADVGPQAPANSAQKGPAGMDEFNATRTAGNFGWPMFMGPNLPYNNFDYAANKAGTFFDKNAPVNNSKYNTGLKQLPPARPAILAYGKDSLNNPWTGFMRGGAVPITGPIYRYDGKNPSKTKLPPHFEGKWFIADANQKWLRVIGLDDQASKALTVGNAFTGISFASTQAYTIVGMAIGIDGALYVVDNGNKSAYRIEYTGSCLPDVTPSSLGGKVNGSNANPNPFWLQPFGSSRMVSLNQGQVGFGLYNLRGERVWEFLRQDTRFQITVPVPREIGAGEVLRAVPLNR
jgi:cytochrome c